MESLIFAANGMYVASYFMHDILRLRLLTVVAAACLATYFYVLPQPMWTVIGWNTFFIALNLFQIARELRARKSATRPAARRRSRLAGKAAGRWRPVRIHRTPAYASERELRPKSAGLRHRGSVSRARRLRRACGRRQVGGRRPCRHRPCHGPCTYAARTSRRGAERPAAGASRQPPRAGSS